MTQNTRVYAEMDKTLTFDSLQFVMLGKHDEMNRGLMAVFLLFLSVLLTCYTRELHHSFAEMTKSVMFL